MVTRSTSRFILYFLLAGIPLLNAVTTSFAQQVPQVPLSTVLLNNERGVIPLTRLDERNIAVISFGNYQAFSDHLGKYADLALFSGTTNAEALLSLDEAVKLYNTLIIAIGTHQLTPAMVNFIQTKALGNQVIITAFGAPEQLVSLDYIAAPLVWSETTGREAEQHAAELIFGGCAANARLPKDISMRYRAGHGFSTEKIRLCYSRPEEVGINGSRLTATIDAIAQEAIREKAAPACVVMVVKDGNVIFEKAYGHHTYDRQRPARTDDIFDLASISKITATTPTIMRLTEQGLVDLNLTMGHYLLQAQHSNKSQVKLRDVMLHEAGFIPFIPFYRNLQPDASRPDSSAAYPVKVADGYYLRKNYYAEVMWPEMLHSKLNPSGKYVYSDISMYVMKEVAEHQTAVPMDEYIQREFYRPLGMKTAGFNPRLRFARNRIVPTEDDKTFRKTLLQGYVHDQGAGMAGGVAGHAGNFSTANDLAIYAQLLLNRGTYGGQQYFRPETVDLFTSRQSATSRRGLGFDRWDPDTTKAYPSRLASPATYGHTGYTGTCIWIDPQYQLTYIFLSNRVHPVVSTKLYELNVRSRIQDAIYQAIREGL